MFPVVTADDIRHFLASQVRGWLGVGLAILPPPSGGTPREPGSGSICPEALGAY